MSSSDTNLLRKLSGTAREIKRFKGFLYAEAAIHQFRKQENKKCVLTDLMKYDGDFSLLLSITIDIFKIKDNSYEVTASQHIRERRISSIKIIIYMLS